MHTFSSAVVGGSGKRQLTDGSFVHLDAIGKLRSLRLPLPPGHHNSARAGERFADGKGVHGTPYGRIMADSLLVWYYEGLALRPVCLRTGACW